jgi:hypothetical protein
MQAKIKQLKNHIEYLESQFVLAKPNERKDMMIKIINAKNLLDKLEDKYYFNK